MPYSVFHCKTQLVFYENEVKMYTHDLEILESISNSIKEAVLSFKNGLNKLSSSQSTLDTRRQVLVLQFPDIQMRAPSGQLVNVPNNKNVYEYKKVWSGVTASRLKSKVSSIKSECVTLNSSIITLNTNIEAAIATTKKGLNDSQESALLWRARLREARKLEMLEK